ncbi:MAG: hypothetical protein NTZ04_01275 [Chloroflexi bacterium]|nr:hypothetical protein [Chloroflexota bacterium]
MRRTNEKAFETVIEAHLLDNGYVPLLRDGWRRAMFSRETNRAWGVVPGA